MKIVLAITFLICFAYITGASPLTPISNSDVADGKYICQATPKNPNGSYVIRMISVNDGQTLGCYLCGPADAKSQYNLKRCLNTLSTRVLTRNIESVHNDSLGYIVLGIDPNNNNNKEMWNNKIKKNFDEIDKASASFSILNQLV